jgi:hypothetical protein
MNYRHFQFNPCNVDEPAYTGVLKKQGTNNPSTFHYYGHIGGLNREIEVSMFDLEREDIEFIMTFELYKNVYALTVTFSYGLQNGYSKILNYQNIERHPEQGINLQVIDRQVYPVILSEGDTVGSYTVEEDVCAGWQVQRALLGDIGLLDLASPVIKLNTTTTLFHTEYFVGVCTNPLKDSDAGDGCFAVMRTGEGGGHTDVCIGRSVGAQITNQRDEGWILLRYPSGKYVDDCHGYTSTEILFICSHDDEPTSGPLYPEDYFKVVCAYQFIWPTHLACPNVTSPSESPSPSNVSSILLGMSGSIAVLLLLVLVGVSITSCYFCARQRAKHSSA